jgi:hypothetical protein
VVDIFLVRERETGEGFERGRGDASLVGTGVFESDDATLFEEETGLLSEEKVGAFDNVLEMRFALRVDESSDIGHVDSLGPSKKFNFMRYNNMAEILTFHRKA